MASNTNHDDHIGEPTKQRGVLKKGVRIDCNGENVPETIKNSTYLNVPDVISRARGNLKLPDSKEPDIISSSSCSSENSTSRKAGSSNLSVSSFSSSSCSSDRPAHLNSYQKNLSSSSDIDENKNLRLIKITKPLVSQSSTGDNEVFEYFPMNRHGQMDLISLAEEEKTLPVSNCGSVLGAFSEKMYPKITSEEWRKNNPDELNEDNQKNMNELKLVDVENDYKPKHKISSGLPLNNATGAVSRERTIAPHVSDPLSSSSLQSSLKFASSKSELQTFPPLVLSNNNFGQSSTNISYLRSSNGPKYNCNSSQSTSSFYVASSVEHRLQQQQETNLGYLLLHPSSSLGSSCSQEIRSSFLNLNIQDHSQNHLFPKNTESIFEDSQSYSVCSCLQSTCLLHQFEMTARCDEKECDNVICHQIKKSIESLQSPDLHMKDLSIDQKSLLQEIHNHHQHCSLPKCSLRGCDFSVNNSSDTTDVLSLTKRKLENYADCYYLPSANKNDFLQFFPQPPKKEVLEEGADWRRLCMLGNSSRAFLATPLPAPNTQYWVIKKVPFPEDEKESLWEIYYTLGKIGHENIVTILWAAKFSDHYQICSVYEGHSLREALLEVQHRHLDSSVICYIMLQLMLATKFLHDNGILFLNWTSSNIIRTGTDESFQVKLCNFSSSAMESSYDSGFLRLTLPIQVQAPELCLHNNIKQASDVWGLGCLFYELVTGHLVWHEDRHEPIEKLLLKMKTRFQHPPVEAEPSFHTENLNPNVTEILTSCWKVDPEERSDLNELGINILAYHLHSTQVHNSLPSLPSLFTKFLKPK
ncbi:uncharacterized protein LOC131931503 [Physella acuta]|uniref:uncharacterized protein LOC131931503 n=1 Tax=Physella acuta TaxID=109671 RepID=UPI0027DC3D58|nr:uncharacterized protein LOC131931503 [Physella acuta]